MSIAYVHIVYLSVHIVYLSVHIVQICTVNALKICNTYNFNTLGRGGGGFKTLYSLLSTGSIQEYPSRTGLCSTVGNKSGNRCMSDCRSRGREFDPGPVPYFLEIDHEIILRVILLPSIESFKKGCCLLQAKVCARSTD